MNIFGYMLSTLQFLDIYNPLPSWKKIEISRVNFWDNFGLFRPDLGKTSILVNFSIKCFEVFVVPYCRVKIQKYPINRFSEKNKRIIFLLIFGPVNSNLTQFFLKVLLSNQATLPSWKTKPKINRFWEKDKRAIFVPILVHVFQFCGNKSREKSILNTFK